MSRSRPEINFSIALIIVFLSALLQMKLRFPYGEKADLLLAGLIALAYFINGFELVVLASFGYFILVGPVLYPEYLYLVLMSLVGVLITRYFLKGGWLTTAILVIFLVPGFYLLADKILLFKFSPIILWDTVWSLLWAFFILLIISNPLTKR